MLAGLPYQKHLESSASLITSYEAIRAGFLKLALERNRRANPYIAQARTLQLTAAKATHASELMNFAELRGGLFAAAGLSEKAQKRLTDEDKERAVQELIENFLEPAGSKFIEELTYRFLLTRGDALGGSMRNIAGTLAEARLSQTLIANLVIASHSYTWLDKNANRWAMPPENSTDIETSIGGLAWESNGQPRTMLFNVKVPIVKNNIDIVLLDCNPTEVRIALTAPELYIALGELKGGIDPAGADEHWKTARSAIERIRRAFSLSNFTPQTFFVGAAIEQKMALEIWAELESLILSNAANLTDDTQVTYSPD